MSERTGLLGVVMCATQQNRLSGGAPLKIGLRRISPPRPMIQGSFDSM